MSALRIPVGAVPGPNLALARSAVLETIHDNPKAVDWAGVALALVTASVKDAQEQERRS